MSPQTITVRLFLPEMIAAESAGKSILQAADLPSSAAVNDMPASGHPVPAGSSQVTEQESESALSSQMTERESGPDQEAR